MMPTSCQEVVSVNRDIERGGETEFGWQALEGLKGRLCPQVQCVRQAQSFVPVMPMEEVPVERCLYCGDGALRVAGWVQRNHMPVPVRQCDTCHAAEIGTQIFMGDFHLPHGGGAAV
ncbi:MAG TPA: hypothetical protein VID73_11930 [Ktedonobacterales bacterium]|jgi:hypothetical protein